MDDSENDAAELTKDSFEGRYRPYTVAVISAGTLVVSTPAWMSRWFCPGVEAWACCQDQ